MTIARTIAALFLFAFLSVSPFAGEEHFTPETQPLAAVRIDSADAALALLETRQLAALGLADRDFAWTIPGLDAKIPSLRALLENMAAGGCADLRYLLMQRGATAAARTGMLGFRFPIAAENGADPDTVLKNLGVLPGGGQSEARPPDGDWRRLLLYPDAQTLRQAFAGRGQPMIGWRDSLRDFLEDRSGRPGIWVDPRPLLGALFLFTPFDARAYLARYGLNSPSALRMELFDSDGDTGFQLRFDNLVPAFAEGGRRNHTLSCGIDNPVMEVSLPAFDSVLNAAKPELASFMFANLNIFALLPRSLTLSVWRRDSGESAWAAALLLPFGEQSRAQVRRVRAWLEYFAGVSPELVGMEALESRWGDELLRIRIGDMSCVMGIVDAAAGGGDNAAVIVSGTAADWPNPFDLSVIPVDSRSVLEWRANLDAASKREIASALADFARDYGVTQYPEAMFENILPDVDAGHVRLDGESATVFSRNGLLPFLIPGVAEAIARRFAAIEKLLSGK